MNSINLKRTFLITLFITLFCRSFNWYSTTFVPYTAVYLMFIALWGLLIIFNWNFDSVSYKRPAGFLILMIALYFIIWGFSNIKDLDVADTMDVMLRSLLMVLFVFVCVYWIHRLDCLHDAIKVGYYAFTALMLLSFMLHVNEISLKRTISSFWESSESLRYRVLFGFGFNNIAAEYSMTSILLSIYMIANVSKNKPNRKLKIFGFLFLDLIMLFIILANNSRGTLLAFLAVVFLVIFCRINKRATLSQLFKRLTFLVIIGVSLILIYMSIKGLTFNDILLKMNRVHFLSNIEALKAGNKWLMGLGNISGVYFRDGNMLYGVKLDYMETFYVAVFVTSGIIGCIWIFIVLYTIIHSVLLQKRTTLTTWILIVLGYMLFLSIFEGFLFSASYITATFFLALVLSYICISRPEFAKHKKYRIVKVIKTPVIEEQNSWIQK